MDYIFIDVKKGIERVGLVENNRLVEFYQNSGQDKKLAGNIYRGRVANVIPGMEAAFVDIGVGKNAYLYVRDALDKDLLYNNEKYNIEDILKVGDEIIVQVVREPIGNKGAKVSSHITLPGNFMVLTPFSKSVNISRKIQDREEIKRLSTLGKEVRQGDIGFIFRTKAAGVEEELFIEEYKNLVQLYQKIERERNFLPCPKLIYKEMNLIDRVLRDVYREDIHRLIINDKDEYEALLRLKEEELPGLRQKLELKEAFNIDYDKDIGNEINRAIGRKVGLKSGGSIIIDETEALTVIDVNTGKYVGKTNLEKTVFKTNMEAAKEIAIQIRLRDIGGIIIIDFIDMKNKEDENSLLRELKKALDRDRNRPNIIGITKLGLVEITRQKRKEGFGAEFIKECPTCKGLGKIFT